MTILYDPVAMNALYDDLQNYGGKMKGEIDSFTSAANAFHDNLAGAEAKAGFDAKNKMLLEGLEDTLTKLDALGAQVENALQRALEADGKVGDGFAAF
ncbi:type VII secretion protein EsxR [Nocardia suismassiliense]|uniref:Type VII secretion protein EsxR n=1 Tax=Nocardia suismassiliense TaxID=2077092 RepID=A0ABW6QUM9_9NOCA|nr:MULTISPECIES: type VII secretion protein EsxR [Nocardia]